MFKRLKVRHTDCKYCSYVGCQWNIDKYGPIGHWLWVIQWYSDKLSPVKAWRRIVNRFTALDYSKVTNVEVDGIDTRDYPDFCDAFVAYAEYKGKPMSEAQLDRLNQDYDFVYQCIVDRIY